MWKTGGLDSSEMATPKRVRTYRPKHSNTYRFLVNGGYIWQVKKRIAYGTDDYNSAIAAAYQRVQSWIDNILIRIVERKRQCFQDRRAVVW